MLTIGPTGISTFGADMTIGGATPTLTIGDGEQKILHLYLMVMRKTIM